MRTDLSLHVDKSSKPIDVLKELSSLAQHSHTTVYRTEFIMKYADEKIKEELRKRLPAMLATFREKLAKKLAVFLTVML